MHEIQAVFHFEGGTWWAESPDLPGLTVVADTMTQLRAQFVDAAAFHLDTDELIEVHDSLIVATASAPLIYSVNTSGAGVNVETGPRRPNVVMQRELAVA